MHRVRNRVVASLVFAICSFRSECSAQRVVWSNPSGGTWETGSNWSTGTPPGTTQTAVFALPGSSVYVVSLNSDHTISGMSVSGRPVTFGLGGNTLQISALELESGQLAISGGTLRKIGDTRIGNAAVPGGVARLNVGANGVLDATGNTFNERLFELGYDGDAEMLVIGNGRAEFDLMYFGARTGSGLLTLSGPDARVNVDNSFYVGRFGTGEVQVLNGAVLQTNGNPWGPGLANAGLVGLGVDDPSSTGTALIDGTGSRWIVNNELIVGRLGSGDLTVSNGGLIESATGRLSQGSLGLSNGQVLITGTGSRWRMAKGLTVGNPLNGAVGFLEVNNGGLLESNYDPSLFPTISGGGGIGRNSTLLVTGVGSEWRDNNQVLTVRAPVNLDGMLRIENGGRATVSDITLSGAIIVTGSGSVLDANFGGTNGIFSDGPNSSILVDNGGILESRGANLQISSVTVTGAGSTWDARSSGNGVSLGLDQGSFSPLGATLTVSDSALVQASDLSLKKNGVVEVDNGTVESSAVSIESQGVIRGNGLVTGKLNADEGSLVQASGGTLTVGDAASQDGFFSRGTVDATNATLVLQDAGRARLDGQTTLSGGSIQGANGVELGGDVSTLSGFGTVNTRVQGGESSTITASGGPLTLGDSTRFDGFRTEGIVDVGADQIELRSAGFASLGVETRLNGGTLSAANGVAAGGGDNIVGTGTVAAPFAGAGGSIIQLTGDMTIGNVSRFDGFFTDGLINVGANSLTILDANAAALGGLTTLGSGGSAGTLTAFNGLEVSFADAIVGHGTVDIGETANTGLVNNGLIAGNSAGEMLTLDGFVTGNGTYDNVIFNGTFSPGLATDAGNMVFMDTSLLMMDLGGLARGTEYDTIFSSGAVTFGGTLKVDYVNGFLASAGDSFDLFDFGSAGGTFDVLKLPTLSSGLAWDSSNLYMDGSLSVTAVPEPSSWALLSIAGIATISASSRRHVRRVKCRKTVLPSGVRSPTAKS